MHVGVPQKRRAPRTQGHIGVRMGLGKSVLSGILQGVLGETPIPQAVKFESTDLQA